MVIFDRLEIADSGKMLYIDAHVNQASYFDNIYLDKVIIQVSDQVSEMDPLSPGDKCIYNETIVGNEKEIHLALAAGADLGVLKTLSDKLLFVYIVCKGVPDPCTPCRLDEMTTLGVVFDVNLLYQQMMQLTKELNRNCQIPKEFIDMILLWQGFKAAVETEHYIVAIDFWNRLFGKNNVLSALNHKCGCNG